MSDPVAMLDAMAGAPPGGPQPSEPVLGDTTRHGELPSRGFRYGGKHAGGSFLMRQMNAEDEGLFQSATPEKTKIIDDLIRQCWLRPEVPFEELMSADKYYMLFFLRSISVDAEYGFNITCPSCGQGFEHKVPVPDGLVKRKLDESDAEPFSVKLPNCGKTLGLKLLRVKDEASIRKMASAEYAKSAKPGSPEYTLRLAHHVVMIEGSLVSIPQAWAFVKKMLTADSLAMRHAIDAADIGISLRIEVSCPRCGVAQKTLVPWTEEFFRPSPKQGAA